MARGSTLNSILQKLRAEAGHSADPALGQNARSMLLGKIQREYERLYWEFKWPHMFVRRDVTMQAGSRYYAFPSDLNLDRLERVDVLYAGRWFPVGYGIDMDLYSIYNSDTDQRLDPVQRWHTHDAGQAQPQFEVWPLPATNGLTLRFSGYRSVNTLVADTDVCLLDDNLIALYVGAELLANQKGGSSQALQAKAQQLLLRLKAAQIKEDQFIKGGRLSRQPRDRRLVVAYVRNQ